MIRFLPEASSELELATQWYRNESPALATRFLQALDYAVFRVQADPESWAKAGKRCRYISLTGFPYLLIFSVGTAEVTTIVAISHTSRRPGYWRSRLQ